MITITFLVLNSQLGLLGALQKRTDLGELNLARSAFTDDSGDDRRLVVTFDNETNAQNAEEFASLNNISAIRDAG